MKAQDLPRDPSAIEHGRLGALRRACDADRAAIAAAYTTVATLHTQRLAYQATVAQATPTSDMHEIAAALAGITVLERALSDANGRVAQLEREAGDTGQRFAHMWAGYRSLLEGALSDELSGARPAPHVLDELAALAGAKS